MPVEYSYNQRTRCIDIRCIETLVLEEIMQYFDALRDDASVERGAVELVDLSRVTHFNLDFKDAATMPSGYASAHEVKEIKATILFGASPLNRGLAELIRAHFLHSLPDHPFRVEASEETARSCAARILAEGNADSC